MMDSDDDLASTGYWPSVADLFMTLFVISIAILAAVFFALLPKASSAGDSAILIAVGEDLKNVRDPVNTLRKPLDGEKIDGVERKLPPISTNESPAFVIAALTETCRLAVLRIKELEDRNRGLTNGDPGYAKIKVEGILVPTNKILKAIDRPEVASGTSGKGVVSKLGEAADGVEQSLGDYKKLLSRYRQKHQNASNWHDWFKEMATKVELTNAQENAGTGLKQAVENINMGGKSQVIDNFIVTIDSLDKQVRELNKRVGELTTATDKPPIITLDDGGYQFPKGRATLSNFLVKLHDKEFPAMKEVLDKYPIIDTLEIVGHTDGTPMGGDGNMDATIPLVLNGGLRVAKLKAASNVDLGLMRALAIREAWEKWVEGQPNKFKPRKVKVRCYSAAQTIPPNGQGQIPKGNNPKARRIEIRFTQLKNKNLNVEGAGLKSEDKYPVIRLK
jgi:flagellar motor protein MotB